MNILHRLSNTFIHLPNLPSVLKPNKAPNPFQLNVIYNALVVARMRFWLKYHFQADILDAQTAHDGLPLNFAEGFETAYSQKIYRILSILKGV